MEKNVIGVKPFTMVLEGSNFKLDDFPTRSVKLGFVDLDGDRRPMANKEYKIISAGDEKLDTLEVPKTQYKRLDMDLYSFYVDDLPDFWSKKNEGFLKISATTNDPSDLKGSQKNATLATNFSVRDGDYAPSFMYRGVFRNIIFQDFINLKFDLYELDTDASQYFNRVKSVINGVPEIKNLDILKGIPYLTLATQLFESIIATFGKNPDDHVWGEIPVMDINPIIGGAFLRDGVYVLFEDKNSNGELVSNADFTYVNEKLKLKKGNVKKGLPNHLIFGLKLNSYHV
ncbi:MAG: hypothetical protein Aureis2KO_03990 [Aureisphaera sp.]